MAGNGFQFQIYLLFCNFETENSGKANIGQSQQEQSSSNTGEILTKQTTKRWCWGNSFILTSQTEPRALQWRTGRGLLAPARTANRFTQRSNWSFQEVNKQVIKAAALPCFSTGPWGSEVACLWQWRFHLVISSSSIFRFQELSQNSICKTLLPSSLPSLCHWPWGVSPWFSYCSECPSSPHEFG